MPTGRDLVAVAMTRIGTPYVYGAEASWSDPKPAAFDCSELVEWACRRLGVAFPDGSRNQYDACRAAGTIIDLRDAYRTVGALLFRMKGATHVAISRGDTTTIEARGQRFGVNTFPAGGRGWTAAGRIPGLTESEAVMLLARNSDGTWYVVDAQGKRPITPPELAMYRAAGVPTVEHGIDAALKLVPDYSSRGAA